jgi:hypothetical protein
LQAVKIKQFGGTGDEEDHWPSGSVGIPDCRTGGAARGSQYWPGAATQPSGLTNVTLARGTDLSDGTIPLQEGTDIVMTQITVVPVDGRDFAVYRFAHDVEVIVP